MSIALNGYQSTPLDVNWVSVDLARASQAGVLNLLLCLTHVDAINWSLQKGS